MDNIIPFPLINSHELKYRRYVPIKTVEDHIDRALKALHFKLVDDLPMIIWYVSSSL
jgi:hypothetical protein